MQEKVICSHCGAECVGDGFSTGYGMDENGNKFCFKCCGEMDRAQLLNMEMGGRMCLYLVKRGEEWHCVNWPRTLDFRIWSVRVGRHNFAGRRYDFWFGVGGKNFHGTCYGDNTQLAHVRRVR